MSFPPGLIILLAGVFIATVRISLFQRSLSILAPIIAITLIWTLPNDSILQVSWLNLTIILFELTPLGQLFGTVFSIMALLGSIFSFGTKSDSLELGAAYIYAGAAICVCFVGDLISLFIFWEIMAIASTYIVWAGKANNSGAAAKRYLLVHLFGGTLLLAGIAGFWLDTNSILFSPMELTTPAQCLILAAFLVNAGAPPISSWLPDK